MHAQRPRPDFRTRLQNWLPKLVLAPSVALILVFVYGFIIFTVYLSFTDSRILPLTTGSDSRITHKLFRLSHWTISITNLAIFASLYIVICTLIGLTLAIFLDQKIRGEGFIAPDLPLPDGAVVHRDRHGVEMVSRSRHRH